MNTKNRPAKEKSLAAKIALVTVIAVCLILGVIGLVLPIIPGLLFLALAVMLASKLSRRVARWANKSTIIRRWSKHHDSIGQLSFSQRLKLAFWVSAKYTVDSLNSLMNRRRASEHGN